MYKKKRKKKKRTKIKKNTPAAVLIRYGRIVDGLERGGGVRVDGRGGEGVCVCVYGVGGGGGSIKNSREGDGRVNGCD